jgi:hypothetical protein
VSAGDVAGLSLSTVGGWLPFVSAGDVGGWLPFVSAGDVAGLSSSTVGGRWRARAPVTWRSCCPFGAQRRGRGGWVALLTCVV